MGRRQFPTMTKEWEIDLLISIYLLQVFGLCLSTFMKVDKDRRSPNEKQKKGLRCVNNRNFMHQYPHGHTFDESEITSTSQAHSTSLGLGFTTIYRSWHFQLKIGCILSRGFIIHIKANTISILIYSLSPTMIDHDNKP